jgi:hypothetical protein
VINLQQARDRRTRERLGRDIERLLDRYAEQHRAARSLVSRDWDLSWFFFRSLAMEWVAEGGCPEDLKARIGAEIDAVDTGR